MVGVASVRVVNFTDETHSKTLGPVERIPAAFPDIAFLHPPLPSMVDQCPRATRPHVAVPHCLAPPIYVAGTAHATAFVLSESVDALADRVNPTPSLPRV